MLHEAIWECFFSGLLFTVQPKCQGYILIQVHCKQWEAGRVRVGLKSLRIQQSRFFLFVCCDLMREPLGTNLFLWQVIQEHLCHSPIFLQLEFSLGHKQWLLQSGPYLLWTKHLPLSTWGKHTLNTHNPPAYIHLSVWHHLLYTGIVSVLKLTWLSQRPSLVLVINRFVF